MGKRGNPKNLKAGPLKTQKPSGGIFLGQGENTREKKMGGGKKYIQRGPIKNARQL